MAGDAARRRLHPGARGVVHVHTTLSDGGGTPEEVVAAASAAGLGVRRHHRPQQPGREGRSRATTTACWCSWAPRSRRTAGHVLGLGIARSRVPLLGRRAGRARRRRDAGRRRLRRAPALAARGLPLDAAGTCPGPWGLELLNGDSQWRDGRLAAAAARRPRSIRSNARYALLGSLTPPDGERSRAGTRCWPSATSPGIAGADAHSRARDHAAVRAALPVLRVRVSPGPQPRAAASGRSRGDAAADRAAIVDALAARPQLRRRSTRWRPPTASRSSAQARRARRVTMGDTVAPAGPRSARAGGRMPRGDARRPAARRPAAWRSGVAALEQARPGAPGVYRVEAYVPGWRVPWVVTNPIYVFDAATLEARRRRAEWPALEHACGNGAAPIHGAAGVHGRARSGFEDGRAGRRSRRGSRRRRCIPPALRPRGPERQPALHVVRAREPRDARPLRMEGPAPAPASGRRVSPLGAAPRPQPGLGRRGPRVVDGLRTHLERVDRRAAPVRALAHPQPEERRPPRPRHRCARSCSCSTTRRSSRGRAGIIWLADVSVFR